MTLPDLVLKEILESTPGAKLTKSDKRPKCVNYGCNKPVAHDGKRHRPVCSHCHKAGYGHHPFAKGVTPFRKGKCSNQDGRLDFCCAMDYEKAPWAIGETDIDHINGDRHDNRPENLMELCSPCHKHKGKVSGDHKKNKKKVL